MKKKIKWIIIGLILIGISFGLYKLGNPSAPVAITTDNQPITFQVKKETLVNKVEVKGKSLYEQETLVYAPYGSEVSSWTVVDGQQVKKGDILFTMDQRAVQNEITQMEAVLRKAKLEGELSDYLSQLNDDSKALETSEEERKRTLVEKEMNRITKELNEVTNSIQAKELQQKKKMLNESVYRSPATGIFLFDNPNKRPQALGNNEYVGKVVDLNKLQFIALVGEQDIFRIKEGMSVQVKMNAMKQLNLAGKVLKVSKFAKTGSDQNSLDQAAQFEVVIVLEPNEYLIAGLSLNGAIETERKEMATVVPTLAISREQDKHFVMFDLGNGQYERRDIKIGMETAEFTEVLEGLKEGDQVVLQ
ncbi:HlyD family secretion protein/macrolide-specific efflux system membrane fusion protein [Paenibacillus castaneae]|uniref:efflux RND transporter periplasmic adaptor subunit n=1 Tax=Paenibacillus castaneae TaxID=474957 RepID=UPI000C9A5DEB|nr:efflux RND transporter periplasmic adaptor subunit [Paenibacillus castaneae]NIK76592.1 HlyD family secretion protein/macrolide-specific efflux system membrane fusion protein [Paenibacillus castaneae]